MVKIFIDPGHGGTDPGAVANGIQEKNITLQISQRIKEILEREYSNVSVRMSRNSDQTVSLNQRTDMANLWGADFLYSIHVNSGGGAGYEDYIYSGLSANSRTAQMQQTVHGEIISRVEMVNRGAKSANFHMLRESNMDAILTENGFIDNSSDAAKMKNAAWIDSVARGHVVGLERVFNLTRIMNTQRIISFYTGGFRGEAISKVHSFITSNNWWYQPSRASDGSMMFQIGGFGEGTVDAKKMEQFLKDNNFWYEIK